MPYIEVIGGEIPTGKWDTKYLFEDIFPEIVINFEGQPRKLNLNNIKSADVVDQEEIKSIAASAGWGIAAGLVAGILTGGLGLIAGGVAGAMAKGRKTVVTFMCELNDGRKFIAATDPQTWKKVMGITMTPEDKRFERKALNTAKIKDI
ncbi:hypothetical protein IQE94_05030 [Synechocystis sp. PCC 7339]|uniref:hypothetical protein n=1 Tax=unclassified Synechocystis TaxID=2640012 RepID=UPI001BB04C4E|nr:MULTISPECIES: hypothetical protein [unclassified Synechocystis]QUS61477.1 hypothetical protein HTZ78_12955 [Synechocystis sp. PCC 7338]UAJ73653.1 hypothetical protein IQE94_05030 [Synechocystis sp. PCC 7339]